MTLALLQRTSGAASLVLSVSQAVDACVFELINLSSNPNADWDKATRVDAQPGENWVPLNTGRGQLVLSPVQVAALEAKEEHTLLIRQVRSGAPSIQSLFKVSAARRATGPQVAVREAVAVGTRARR